MRPTLLAALWTVGIVVACSLPGSSIPNAPFLPLSIDKWVHVGLFLGFGALWSAARPGRTGAVFGAGVALAVAIEVWQGALPIGRSADPYDAAADVVGLVLGIALARWVARRTAARG